MLFPISYVSLPLFFFSFYLLSMFILLNSSFSHSDLSTSCLCVCLCCEAAPLSRPFHFLLFVIINKYPYNKLQYLDLPTYCTWFQFRKPFVFLMLRKKHETTPEEWKIYLNEFRASHWRSGTVNLRQYVLMSKSLIIPETSSERPGMYGPPVA